MSRRWKLRSRIVPEYALFNNDKERDRVSEQFRSSSKFAQIIWIWSFLYVVCLAGYYLLPEHWPFKLISERFHLFLNGMGLFLFVAIIFINAKSPQKFLRQELCKRGIPICIKCGYDLRGQTEPRCPECGQEFDEKLLTNSDTQK
ncbi:MAG: hypothetical protein ACYTF1_14640 [Planctomycetota bacterium]